MEELKTKTYSNVIRSLISPVLTDRKFKGSYSSFDEALKRCDKDSTTEGMRIKFLEWYRSRSGKQIHSDEIDQQLLSSFFIVMKLLDKKEMRVLDIGGSFGNHYKRFRSEIPKSLKLNWDVIETKTLIKKAVILSQDDDLNFYDNTSMVKEKKYDVIFSGAFQYLPDPDDTMNELVKLDHNYFVFNRLPFINDFDDRLTIEKASRSGKSYPSWIFARNKWESFFTKYYNIKYRWHTASEVYLGWNKIPIEGLLLQKR
jgi:putative methyltransferase (TIGR04325 family)